MQNLGNNQLQTYNPGDITTNKEVQAAMAAIQARFMLAQLPQMRRSHADIKAKVIELCQRKEFAEESLYHVKVGSKFERGQWIDVFDDDFNIRAAEQFMIMYRNIFTELYTIFETDEFAKMGLTMTDLESNITYQDEFTLMKTIERKKLKKDQEAIATRQNSKDDTVYIIRCTPDEMAKKQAAIASKKIRKMFFRMFPVDIKTEARKTVEETIKNDIKENIADRRAKMLLRFSEFGITSEEIKLYAEKDIDSLNVDDLMELGKIYNGIREGDLKWQDVINNKLSNNDQTDTIDPDVDLQDNPDAVEPKRKEEQAPAPSLQPEKKKEKDTNTKPRQQKKKETKKKETPAPTPEPDKNPENKTPSLQTCPACDGAAQVYNPDTDENEDCEECQGTGQIEVEDEPKKEPVKETKKEKKTQASKTTSKQRSMARALIMDAQYFAEEDRRELETKLHLFPRMLEKENTDKLAVISEERLLEVGEEIQRLAAEKGIDL